MKPKRGVLVNTILILTFLTSLSGPLGVFGLPVTGEAGEMVPLASQPQPIERYVPGFTDFLFSLRKGNKRQIAGVYVPGTLALPVIQQPAGNPGYVSTKEGVVTHFGLAERYGTTGFLAHNNLSGALFFNLQIGQNVVVVYGDGSFKRYVIQEIREYQATAPKSPYSDFIDLKNTGVRLSSSDLFYQIYSQRDQVVFQTCIGKDGNLSWGRFFGIAVPVKTVTSHDRLSRLVQ
jgi:hypothetical protein